MASISRSQGINRRPEVVFEFVAVNHLSHPRWDPHMKLEQLTEGELASVHVDPQMFDASLQNMKRLIESET